MTSYRLPAHLPDDVQQWCEAHPEVANMVVRAHVEHWSAQRLLDAFKGSDYHQEVVALDKKWLDR